MCDKKIIDTINILLKRKKNSNYSILTQMSIRMDMPHDKKNYYGWHRDNNTNIPGSEVLQYGCLLFQI